MPTPDEVRAALEYVALDATCEPFQDRGYGPQCVYCGQPPPNHIDCIRVHMQALAASVRELEEELRDLKMDAGMSDGCLDMVRETLVSLGVDMESCPPMMYREAIMNAIRTAKGV